MLYSSSIIQYFACIYKNQAFKSNTFFSACKHSGRMFRTPHAANGCPVRSASARSELRSTRIDIKTHDTLFAHITNVLSSSCLFYRYLFPLPIPCVARYAFGRAKGKQHDTNGQSTENPMIRIKFCLYRKCGASKSSILFVAYETKSSIPAELVVRCLTYRKFDAMELRVRCDGTFRAL